MDFLFEKRLQLASATFIFEIRILEDNGHEGVFKKTVTAKNSGESWVALLKELRTMKILESVIKISKVS